MSSDLYVSLSGQMALTEQLATVAHNVANMRTGGFRAETVQFDTVFSDYGRDNHAFAALGKTHIDRKPGPIEATGNPLDVAIVGGGFFALETPGGTAYTRDGRFTVSEFGDLTTLTGFNVLDAGGAPIALDPGAGPIDIGADGTISQNGNQVAQLGLVNLPANANLTRFGDSAVKSDRPAEPVVDASLNAVRQGFREGSNVDPVRSLVDLITIQRQHDMTAAHQDDRHEALRRAVQTLGGE